MIQFANEYTAPLVRQMWKTCFGDTEEFLDIYFHYKYKNENTLIYFDGDKAVASLQMLPYTITFYGETIPFAYLAGLCTLPEYRKRGYMAELIREAHRVIYERGISLSILIPAEDWLYQFYEKYDYEQVFEQDCNLIPLKEIIDAYPNGGEAYQIFNSLFNDKDFCVQKTEPDFRTIVEEYMSDGCPTKSNLSGMACVINAQKLLPLYARRNVDKCFKLRINCYSIDGIDTYNIRNGQVRLCSDNEPDCDMEVDNRLLCRLLFGYKIGELDVRYKMFFAEHHPIMNLMLE